MRTLIPVLVSLTALLGTSGRSETNAATDSLYYPAFVPAREPEGELSPPGARPSEKTAEARTAEAKLRVEREARYRKAVLKNREHETAAANRILEALARCDEVELLALNPDPRTIESPQQSLVRYTANERFAGGFSIVGRAQTTKATEIKTLVAALKQGFAESTGESADCFEPRHGLRFSSGGKTYLAIVCFQCGQAYVGEIGSETNRAELLIARSPEKIFDAIFTGHSLKKAP